jgi:hypothetical protein
MSEKFDQAQALVKRLMEDVGGSADAYEPPLDPSGAPNEPGEEETEVSGSSDDADLGIWTASAPTSDYEPEECADGDIQWPPEGVCWTNPDPVNDNYVSRGVVEDHAELLSLWKAFEAAIETGESQEAEMDSGPLNVEVSQTSPLISLEDTVKDRCYLYDCRGAAAGIIMIWVNTLSTRADLGYIQDGYVFLRK